jgi:nucleoside-diphosphate-sugar epimerase
MSEPSLRIMVTGAGGNLGRKLVTTLAGLDRCSGIVAVDREDIADRFPASVRSRVQTVVADLTVRSSAWVDAMSGLDAVVHLAALHPYPDATWEQAFASCDMTLNVLLEALRGGLPRVVFASSNHVMGGYKDPPLATSIGPGKLTTDLKPAPGTRRFDGEKFWDSLPYATSKLIGEKICAASAEASGGKLSTVAVRIGWTMPGENDPRNMAQALELPTSGALDSDAQRDLRWFRNMWLSDADFSRLLVAAITADRGNWPAPSIIVNGLSDNRRTDWDLSSARELIGYQPQDDVYKIVED